MSDSAMMQVEVAYALPDRQAIIPLQVTAGTTALEAAQRSGVADRFEGIDLEDSRLGIFGKLVTPEHVLQAGDRVEVYRPLKADPKEVRKARAARVKERREEDSGAE
ncbi:MAG: RnfH family protein [Haliea sp.]|nr:RnfH family protein [Haliea sp.]MDP5063786.1 RnfH family protein [Haliea sp.]